MRVYGHLGDHNASSKLVFESDELPTARTPYGTRSKKRKKTKEKPVAKKSMVKKPATKTRVRTAAFKPQVYRTQYVKWSDLTADIDDQSLVESLYKELSDCWFDGALIPQADVAYRVGLEMTRFTPEARLTLVPVLDRVSSLPSVSFVQF